MTDEEKRERIRALNDELRTTFKGGLVHKTQGVAQLDEAHMIELIDAVQGERAFGEDNDPHKEHDFGTVQLSRGGPLCFWKIDYYDLDLEYGSEHPEDPAMTKRVLLLLLADEY